MLIRPIRLDDDAEAFALYAVLRTSQLADNPDRATWSRDEALAEMRDPIGQDVVAVGAFDGSESGDLLGVSVAFFPLEDNVTKVYAELAVHPEHRRRGVGSALVEDLLDRVRTAGRTTVLAEAWYGFDRRDDHPYRRFAERHGFALASTEVARKLDLPVPDGQIQAWIDEAAPYHRDYLIETFYDDDVPDALLPSLCELVNQLAVDAPSGDIDFEPESLTPEDYVRRRERLRSSGTASCVTLALDGEQRVSATTVIGAPAGDSRAHQWVTIVGEPHRGHRLGLALKARNLRALQRRHPDRTSVHTTNAEVNGPMIAINEHMGFEPVELEAEFQRILDS